MGVASISEAHAAFGVRSSLDRSACVALDEAIVHDRNLLVAGPRGERAVECAVVFARDLVVPERDARSFSLRRVADVVRVDSLLEVDYRSTDCSVVRRDIFI